MIFVAIVSICFILFAMVVFIGAPYVPSQKKYIARAFEHFEVSPLDVIADIGSGDGVVLRTASKFGAKSVGYEINPLLVGISKWLSMKDKNVKILWQNAWEAILPPDVTFVYAFAVARDEEKLTRLLQREADRLGRPLKLLCLASPFKHKEAVDTFEAYHLYIFQPLQVKNA